jgi:hypothetical protein
MMTVLTLTKLLLLFLVIIFAVFFIRTWQLLWTDEQTQFSRGSASTMPDGLYAGTVPGPKISWLGKKFNASARTGINIFSSGVGKTVEKYPFVLSAGHGVHDSIQVIKIDYNVAENPLWLRPILDEIVQTGPGEYLGKLQVRILPGYPFTLTYFRLSTTS